MMELLFILKGFLIVFTLVLIITNETLCKIILATLGIGFLWLVGKCFWP